MARPEPIPSHASHAAYATWLAAVERRMREELGLSLGDLPGLPTREGFEIGDSPAEFVVGAVLDHAVALGVTRRRRPSRTTPPPPPEKAPRP